LVFGLFENVRVTTVVLAGKEVGRRFAAEITIDALSIYIEFSRNALGMFVFFISHDSWKSEQWGESVKIPWLIIAPKE
jgi:hypothetical protein